MGTVRFGVSLDSYLLERFDRYVEKSGFPTRSEAIKNLMTDALTHDEWTKGDVVAGSITFSYDHHKSGVVNSLLSVQHDFCPEIICSQHAHLDHDACLETIVVRGKAARIQKLLNSLRQIKGLNNLTLTVVFSGI